MTNKLRNAPHESVLGFIECIGSMRFGNTEYEVRKRCVIDHLIP